jgi:8-oxo-dGTP diphosphatase
MISCTFENKTRAFLRHVTVDALALQDEKLLLVKRAENLTLEAGKYALPGGFLDRDETAAEGVLRELLEETGYQGRAASLFRVNSDPHRRGEDRQNVSFVYLVKVGDQTAKPDWEVQSVSWFDLNELPPPEKIAFDHRETINLYLKYLKSPFPLPLLS